MYLLVPDPELSAGAGKAEIAAAVQFLVGETHAQQRKVRPKRFSNGNLRAGVKAGLIIDGTRYLARHHSFGLRAGCVSCLLHYP